MTGSSLLFTTPWALLALAVLPVLWWLLRVTPPAPRTEVFPAIRLLAGLFSLEETPARTPPWLLALRLLAAGLVIVALAGPVLDAPKKLAGDGPVLLVIDDGWASAGDFPRKIQAASNLLDRLQRDGRMVALLATAADAAGVTPVATPPMPAALLRARVAALVPRPWAPDRAASAAALHAWRYPGAAVIYLGDGLTDGSDFSDFAGALVAAGSVTQLGGDTPPTRLLLPPRLDGDRLFMRLAQTPQGIAGTASVLAQSGDGRTLSKIQLDLPAGTVAAEGAIELPAELRNRLDRLVLEGPPSAGSVVLLDERWRRRPVGLLASGQAAIAAGGGERPLTGPLFFLRRALAPYTELREGTLSTLLSRELSVLILADQAVTGAEDRAALAAWVQHGGLLVRFAGPMMAEESQAPNAEKTGAGKTPDPLLPVALLAGERALGGALSWSEPAALAPFPQASPFAGLSVPDEVRVNRQVLAEPSAGLAAAAWATLADGTPLVTESARGAGRVVLFHVTANADWSNLPLSGLFVDMLRRLVQFSTGITDAGGDTLLAPAATLDGFGVLGPPSPAATGLVARDVADGAVSATHPPGLYGPENGRRAKNLGGVTTAPELAPKIPGADLAPIGGGAPERPVGPWLLAGAVLLLVLDVFASLALRGLLARRRVVAGLLLVILALAGPAVAQPRPKVAVVPENPALATRLAAVVTGNDAADRIAALGLAGLTDYVNQRTAASLAPPDPVVPGHDDLSFYPILYWLVTADMATPDRGAVAALNAYMGRGGILLIDTDGDSDAGTALRRVTAGLSIPALAALTAEHVLARSFYLLSEFPGRFAGGTVWVQRDQDRANDSVSPVIIGTNGWAQAWATDRIDRSGRSPNSTLADAGSNEGAGIPASNRQRVLAYRFGVNLVMYALTGNYKGDQVHVPQILQRLGQ